MILAIKTMRYLKDFFETNDLINGLFENRYTFKQKNDVYLHVTIYKQNGDRVSIKNKYARMNVRFTRENLIDFLSNDLYPFDKKRIIKTIKKLTPFEKKFLNTFSQNYQKFMAQLPTLII